VSWHFLSAELARLPWRFLESWFWGNIVSNNVTRDETEPPAHHTSSWEPITPHAPPASADACILHCRGRCTCEDVFFWENRNTLFLIWLNPRLLWVKLYLQTCTRRYSWEHCVTPCTCTYRLSQKVNAD
jgi:hypothetical protein